MKKKYLTKPEEILALKDSDTKIYTDNCKAYFQFVNGIFCRFYENGEVYFNAMLPIGIDDDERNYILEEEPVKEADVNDIGKLCWFWDTNETDKMVDILKDTSIGPRHFERKTAGWYYHCRRLTTAELAEITGYKVEE